MRKPLRRAEHRHAAFNFTDTVTVKLTLNFAKGYLTKNINKCYHILMRILGIETSCDDTCASMLEASGGLMRPRFRVLSNIVSSQVNVHKKYGGVVPSLAAREHAKNIVPVLRRALKANSYTLKTIDLIAVTTHPGLLPALLIGVHSARTLAWYFKKPILGINHLEAHLVANWLQPRNYAKRHAKQRKRIPRGSASSSELFCEFPAIGLVVSGGHTQLVLMKKFGSARIVGETRDDAAGEAFDKVARLFDLPFPGGAPVAALAAKSKTRNSSARDGSASGGKNGIILPRPMINSPDLDFSFSGLKTAVLYLLRDNPRINKAALAAAFQQAVIDVLVAKTLHAARIYNAKTVMLGGGVAANLELRRQLGETLARELPSTHYSLPATHYALDNAAMIAAAAYFRWHLLSSAQRKLATWKKVRVRA